VHCEQSVKREINQKDATIILLSTSVSTCFGHHYAHLQENKDRVTAYGVLLWFCWMWLVAVVGRCVVGCEGFSSTESNRILHSAHSLQRSAPQPLPTTSNWSSRCQILRVCFYILVLVILHPKSIFSAQHCIVTYGLPASTIFFRYLINVAIFQTKKKFFEHKICFDILYNFCTKRFSF
jgi:hypothetical protein